MDEGRKYWNQIMVFGYSVIWSDNREFIKRLSAKLNNAGVPHSCTLDMHIEIHLEENPSWTFYKPLGCSFGCFLCFKHIPAKIRDKIIVRLMSTFKLFYGKS